MTDDEIHALSGAYAVDAVDDLERARFEQHLAVCPQCREEVDSLRGAAGQLGALADRLPPPSLRASVLHDITAVRPLPPLAAPATRSAAPARRPWRGRLVAAAAAVAVLGGGAAIGLHPWSPEQTQTTTVAQQVLSAPDASRTEHAMPGGVSATVVRSATVGHAVLVTQSMPAAPAGSVYQLWLEDAAGSMHSAGLMSSAGDQTVVLEGDAAHATGFGITVEPPGGSPAPTTTPVVLFPLA